MGRRKVYIVLERSLSEKQPDKALAELGLGGFSKYDLLLQHSSKEHANRSMDDKKQYAFQLLF